MARLLLGALFLLFCYTGIKGRHLLTPFVSPIRGLLPNLAVAVLLLATFLLNAKSALRLFQRLNLVEPSRSRSFNVAFASILLIGVLCRIIWTRSVLFPASTPDGYTYLLPALGHPKLPLTEARPIAFPYLISLSLALFGHPVGILIVHNLLALISAAVLALAVRWRLDLPVVSLILLVYMLFSAKNVAFEYLLLTEHLFRCIFALTLGLLLWVKRPGPGLAAVLTALTVIAILTKPNALVLVPGVLSGFLVARWHSDETWKRTLRSAAIYTAIVIFSIAGYMTLQFKRFGSFQITSMTGFGLYSHVNLLTDLDGPAYPEVKRELRRFFPLYLAKYGSRGRNMYDWVLWGSPTPEIESDFGSSSPSKVVSEYAEHHGSGSVFHRMDRIFMDLALEGIRAHPVRYVGMSLASTWGLIADGLTFSYLLTPIADPGVAERAEFFRRWSVTAHTRSEHLVVPQSYRPVGQRSIVVLLPVVVSRLFSVWFAPVAIAAIALFAVGIGGGEESRLRGSALIPSIVTVAGYLVLCGFLVPGEPPRYVEPIQDLIVLLTLAMLAVGWQFLAKVGSARPQRS